MSEVLTSGMVGTPLDGPIPRPPLYGLPSVAQEVPWEDRGGHVLVPYPDGLIADGEGGYTGPVFGHDPCADASARVKEYPDALDIPDGFPSFTGYLGEVCTAWNIGSWPEWKARANVALAAREAWALERQLADASLLSPAPSLNDAGVDILTGSPAPATAVAFLEEAIAATGIEGVLHLPKPVVAFLGADYFTNAGGILRTAVGTPVIAGSGYVGAAEPTGGAAAAAGQSWCYATGAILYSRSGTIYNAPESIAEALDRDDNTVVYRAERDLWVGWDKQLQAAILADWSP